MKLLQTLLCFIIIVPSLQSQCETWLDSPQKDEAENAHVIYRQHLKANAWADALKFWQTAYAIAPAADGRRDWHFRDGIEIYKHFYAEENDEARKKEYKEKILALYDQWINCIGQQAISFKGCNDEDCIKMKQGTTMGKKGIDMFITFQYPRMDVYNLMKDAVSLSGWETDYQVFRPYAQVVTGLIMKGTLEPQEARDAHQLLNDIANYNIENDEKMAPYYEYEKNAMNQVFVTIEKQIYDCDYFINKYKPQYEEDPDNIELIKEIVVTLKQQDCDTTLPFLAELEGKYSKYAAEFNAQQLAEFEKKNPAAWANRLYKEGKFGAAVEKYRNAIEIEDDPEKKATYYFSIASIQFRKLGQYGPARENARKAAQLKSGWGRPYMLIGDMYARSSSDCGSDAYTRGLAVLAAIDKWSHAKSIDSEVAAEANRNIAKYSQYMPPQEEAHMRNVSSGTSVSVGCWIGETVKVRFN